MASISPTTTPWRSGGASGVTEATSTPALIRRSAAWPALSGRSTNSRIQRYGIFTIAGTASPDWLGGGPEATAVDSCELPEEAEVVLEEQTDVVDPVLEHGHTLDAHAEGPARDLFRVVADIAKHLRVHHPRAQDLEPSRLLA